MFNAAKSRRAYSTQSEEHTDTVQICVMEMMILVSFSSNSNSAKHTGHVPLALVLMKRLLHGSLV